MQVPGQSVLSSGFSVVVVVVVGGGVGRKYGGVRITSFLGGANCWLPPLKMLATKGKREASPAPPPPDPPELKFGFLSGFDVLPPPLPPKTPKRAGPSTGKSAAAALPAPLFPVAAVRSCGAIPKSNEVKSPEPPPELEGLEGCRNGGFLGGGFGVVGFRTSTTLLFPPSLLELQQTVPC